VIDILKRRKSTRNFSDKLIGKNIIDQILEAALLSPSSRGIDPWSFVVVEDKKTIKELSLSKEHGSAFLAEAPLVIAVIADNAKSDVWIEDCSIASIIIQLESESIGLGSCWVQIRKRKTKDGTESDHFVKKTLGIPAEYSVLSLIGIGYPAVENTSSKNKKPDINKCLYNSFNTRYFNESNG
jgi:nitroreductase